MENLIVIKTNKPLGHSILSSIVDATKSTVIVLPMTCTITTAEEAVAELRSYKEAIERFLPADNS